MEATNNRLKFLRDKELVNELKFEGKSVQIKPKMINDIYYFPNDEVFQNAQKMAESLKIKFPHMKPARIARKVAEYYHLQKA